MEALIAWLYDSPMSALMNGPRWSWPIAESVHFTGLILMAGTVGAFDLRLLGLARGIRPAALHRLLRFGVAGFLLSLLTGLLFICGAPEQYFYNHAFHFKAAALVLMGVNVGLFYALEFPTVRALGPGETAPRRARIMAAISLALLVAVMLFGRMLTFFRPPY